MEHIVSDDQTCSVPGRSILTNCHTIRDIVDYCEEKNLPAALLSIDQMKAFDRVDWDFLFKTLNAYNFGPDLLSWIKVLYSNINSIVRVNGFLSDSFTLQRGVRQGCPLSPFLYVLVAEAFSNSIRRNKKIKGINIEGIEIKVTQYADDTTLTLCNSTSIDESFVVIKEFEKASGAKINIDKCEGLWLGCFKNRIDKPYGFNWEKKSLKILGLYFGTEMTNKQNWEQRIQKFNRTLNLWKMRDLSFRGKAVVVNQLVASALWYPATILHFPRWVIKRINEAIWNFLYDGKKDLISRKQAKLPHKKGGLNIIDIEKKARALKLSWLVKLFKQEYDGKWKALFQYFLGSYKNLGNGSAVLKCFLSSYISTDYVLFINNF